MTDDPQSNHVQNESAGEAAPARVPQGMHLFDRRKPDRITVPYYVIEQFAPLIGPYALVTYLGLCFRVGRIKRVHPSYATIAKDIGISRSSVERAMRVLKQHGLVLIVPRIDGRGQHSNYIYLVDPGTTLADIEQQPPPPKAPPTPPTAPAPPAESRPPVDPTARAPSIGRRAAEVDPRSTTSGESDPPPPDAWHEHTEQARRLCDQWMILVLCTAHHLRREHKRDFTLAAIDLLRRGVSVAALEEAINDPERDRAEWPRFLRERLLKRRTPTEAERAAKVARERAARQLDEEEAREANSRARAFGGMAGLHRLKAQGLDVKTVLKGLPLENNSEK